MAHSANTAPALTPASFYEACRTALLAHDTALLAAGVADGAFRDDAFYLYPPITVLPRTSNSPTEQQGQLELTDYSIYETNWWQAQASSGRDWRIKESVALEREELAKGQPPFTLSFYVPEYRPGASLAAQYYSFVPSTIHPRATGGLRTLVHSYEGPTRTIPPVLTIPDGLHDTPIIVSRHKPPGQKRAAYELIRDPQKNPQLVEICRALGNMTIYKRRTR